MWQIEQHQTQVQILFLDNKILSGFLVEDYL